MIEMLLELEKEKIEKVKNSSQNTNCLDIACLNNVKINNETQKVLARAKQELNQELYRDFISIIAKKLKRFPGMTITSINSYKNPEGIQKFSFSAYYNPYNFDEFMEQ